MFITFFSIGKWLHLPFYLLIDTGVVLLGKYFEEEGVTGAIDYAYQITFFLALA